MNIVVKRILAVILACALAVVLAVVGFIVGGCLTHREVLNQRRNQPNNWSRIDLLGERVDTRLPQPKAIAALSLDPQSLCLFPRLSSLQTDCRAPRIAAPNSAIGTLTEPAAASAGSELI